MKVVRLVRPSVSSDLLYTHWRTSVQFTVYCSIAEEFKSDDVVKITTETKDADVTEEVYIFLENRTNFDRELLGS